MPHVDAIFGGPPCQGFSISGLRKFDDPRNALYLSYLELVSKIKPKAFVIENVPGLVTLFEGKVKNDIVKKMEDIGYNVSLKILCATDYGVPQNRRRVIIVGLQKDYGKFIYPAISKKIITCEMAISDLPSLNDTIGANVQEYSSAPLNAYQTLMRKNSEFVYNHIASVHSERVKKIISLVPDGGNYKDLPPEYYNTRNFHVAWTRFASDKPAPTIDTGHRHHFHYKYNRVPTVRECARIQSFPDNFIFYGNKTQQYRQVGNAVPPLMAKEIALQLALILKGDNY